jgi:hypothetical protein
MDLGDDCDLLCISCQLSGRPDPSPNSRTRRVFQRDTMRTPNADTQGKVFAH